MYNIPILLAAESSSLGFSELLEQGGNTLIILILVSVFTGALTVFLILSLRMSILAPASFISEAEKVARSHDYEALKALCSNSDSSAAKIIGSAAEEMHLNPQAGYQVIRDTVEDEGGRQAGFIWQKVQYLMDVAVAAPMIGLLGTVLGMREAFSGIRDGFGTVKQLHLAAGVSKALITTAAGMALGIAAMIIYAFFRGRVNRLLAELEERCGKVLRIFASKN